jgi:hypothetical protein
MEEYIEGVDMKRFARICMVLPAIFLVAGFTACENPAGEGGGGGGGNGRLIINGFPAGSSLAITVYNYSGDITSQTGFASVIENPIGVSMNYATASSVSLVDMSGNTFSQTGDFMITLVDSANPAAGILFKTGVSFVNGNATISYDEMLKFVDLPLLDDDGNSSVNLVTVIAVSTSVGKGSTVQFYAVVTGTGNPSQTVSWSITGDHAAETTINNGVLSVAAGETASSLTIRATATADTTKYGEATVTVTEPGEEGDSSINTVTVVAVNTSVGKGLTLQFYAVVTGTGNPSQTVSWSITGDHAAETAINNGVLSVAAGETVSSLTVRATATADTSKYGEATVTVTEPEPEPGPGSDYSVSLVTVSGAGSVSKGATLQFAAVVTGTGNPPQTVSWSITGSHAAGTSINNSGLLSVAAGETVSSLTVRATATADTTKYGEAAVTVTEPEPGPGANYSVSQVSVSREGTSVNKGASLQFSAAVTGTGNPPQTVSWSITGSHAAGTSINNSGLLTVAAGETASSLTVRATSTADTTKYGEAAVTVTEPDPGPGPGSDYSVSQVSVSAASPSVGKGATVQFTATVTGTGNPPQTVTWSLTGDHVAGTTINNGLLLVAAGEIASSLTVRATSTADTTKYGEATVTVTEPGNASITITFEGPANEDIAVDHITNDPYYDSAIPVLENGVWQDGSNPVQYHQFYALAGTSYAINWNDSFEGDRSKSADVGISAYWKATDTVIFDRTDSGWVSPRTFTADRSGIVVLKVEYYSGGNTTGTYAVKYTAPGSADNVTNLGSVGDTLTLSVANAGSYGNFRWLLDGRELSETTGSITIDTMVLDIGLHRLTVIAVKAGISYSHELRFPIND